MTPRKAFNELWEFIEELNLDQPAEDNLKDALCVLGLAALIAEEPVGGHLAKQDELEAKFFLEMKYREVEA